jgi:hypothetical protein
MDRLEGRAPTIAAAIQRLGDRYFGDGGGAQRLEAFQEHIQHRLDGQPTPLPSVFPSRPHGPVIDPDAVPPGYFQPGVNYFEANADRPPNSTR